jgi:hypothetical protein
MENTENCKTVEEGDGVKVDQLSSWKYFSDYIYQNYSITRDYIFRGQRREDWGLTSTLYRTVGEKWLLSYREVARNHFDRFKLATRGRIKTSLLGLDEEKELWALGQHHGLKTPLLDWTNSPFVAAYFAFLKDLPDNTDNRAVFALSKFVIKEMSHWIGNNLEKLGLDRSKRQGLKLEIFEPESNENPNLVSQNGLFTVGQEFDDIQSWVKSYYPKWIKNIPLARKTTALFKLLIPDKDRIGFLKSLNQMNINHLTLFPDLFGASKYCNFELEIEED